MGVDRGDRSVRSWAGIHVGIREAELRVIEGIEGLKAELQSQSLKLNVLEKREIEIRNSRRTYRIARGIAETAAGSGVTVNSILAGPTESEGVGTFVKAMAKQQNKSNEDVEKEFFATARPSSLLKRFATVDEVAALVTYLAGELSSATTGAALRVDGGVVRAIL